MKIADVVAQLQLILPKYTDYFSETSQITSITAFGGVATIIAPQHGLQNNGAVTISNIYQETPLNSVSRDGLIFTFGSSVRHDLTYGYPGYENVILGGFTDSVWNASFKLMEVHTRKDFKIQSVNPNLPILNGNEYLLEDRVDGINGRYPVTVIDLNTLQISGDFQDGEYNAGDLGTIKNSVNIAGSVDIKRSIEEYTEQEVDDMWMFVTPSDAVASKDRNTFSDAEATFANGQEPRLRLMDGFSLFLFGNVSEEIAGVDLLDIFRHDLLTPIMKSVSGVRFGTGLSGIGDFKTVLLRHNFVYYDRAILIYQYVFQFSNDITGSDQAEDGDTRAFSEIDFTQSIGGDDTTNMTFKPELPD